MKHEANFAYLRREGRVSKNIKLPIILKKN